MNGLHKYLNYIWSMENEAKHYGSNGDITARIMFCLGKLGKAPSVNQLQQHKCQNYVQFSRREIKHKYIIRYIYSRENEAKHHGSKGDITARIEADTKVKIEAMNRSVAANKEQVIFKQLFYIILLIVPILDLLLMIKVMKYFVKHGGCVFILQQIEKE